MTHFTCCWWVVSLQQSLIHTRNALACWRTTTQGRSWIWLCLSGSTLFLVGGLMNTVRVFKMQRTEGLRLEKLRGSVHERLAKVREELPLILESNKKSRKQQEEGRPVSAPTSVPTPYKDALLGSLTRSIVWRSRWGMISVPCGLWLCSSILLLSVSLLFSIHSLDMLLE